jgi:signal transduction histidine kinase
LTRQNLQLEAAITELQELDELKSRFVSVAAHELRTPLTSISGYLEVLLDEELSPLTTDQREYIEIVRHSTDRMLNIVTNLLDVTRIEAGRIELVLQPVALPKLVQVVAAEIKPQLEAKAKRLQLHTAPDLPPALCDKDRAIQIIENLLSNAEKYTPRGSLIVVEAGLAREEGFLEIAVIDNGVGISTEDQEKIFSRFFRTRSAAAVGASGAGLGLHITRSLVELHGGQIWFESELGHGSTFHVTFPIAG